MNIKRKAKGIEMAKRVLFCSFAILNLSALIGLFVYFQTGLGQTWTKPSSCNFNRIPHTKQSQNLYHDHEAQAALYKPYVDTNRFAESILLNVQGLRDTKTMDNPMDRLKSLEHKQISTVLMVWCNSTFNFKDMLSVLSVATFLKPDYITFHYDVFPTSNEYVQFIQSLMIRYPYLKFEHSPSMCDNGSFNTAYVKTMTQDIYVSFDTMLAEPLSQSFLHENSALIVKHGEKLLLQTKKTSKSTNPTMVQCHTSKTQPSGNIKNIKWPCFVLPGTSPADIWQCNMAFCETARLVMYNQRQAIMPVEHDHQVIPNVVHYLMLGKTEVGFMWYMSMLSFIYIGNVTKLFIHCDKHPTGDYWSKLIKHVHRKDLIFVVHRENPRVMFNQNLRGSIEHAVDTIKVGILHQYGGMIVDVDLLLIKPLSPKMFRHDFVIGRDVCGRNVCPGTVNIGFLMSKPGSLFSRLYINSMRVYRDEEWLWNSGIVPFRLIEENPTLAFISPELQLVCPDARCVPYGDLKEETADLRQWQRLAFSLHFVYPDPFSSEKDLKTKNGYIREVGEYILSRAGIAI